MTDWGAVGRSLSPLALLADLRAMGAKVGRPKQRVVAIDAFEFCVSATICLKLPLLSAGTSSSQRLRLRRVSRVR